MAVIPEPWPLRDLVLRTPRLELRPDDDSGLRELVALAHLGVHDPELMPFHVPWTDAPPAELGRNVVQHFWSQRAALRRDEWTINFLIRCDGAVAGTQGVGATNFRIVREVRTGSWLGREHQGRGLGTEMRAAVLMFAFERLGAQTARSGAFTDNGASLAVSRKLGYLPDGTSRWARRGAAAVEQRWVVHAEAFDRHRPQWTLEVSGLTPECLALLGA